MIPNNYLVINYETNEIIIFDTFKEAEVFCVSNPLDELYIYKAVQSKEETRTKS